MPEETREEGLGGRLPLLREPDLNMAQRKMWDFLVRHREPEGQRAGFQTRSQEGTFIGPFNGFLYVPEIADALNQWAEAQSKADLLTPQVRQIIILSVGAVWKSAYELYAHRAAAGAVGIPGPVVEAIVEGREPPDLQPALRAAYRFTHALVREHDVADAIYADALAQFGLEGIFGIVHLTGQYLVISALLNAFRVPAPAPLTPAS